MLWASAASARTERLRWTSASVDKFSIYLRLASTSYPSVGINAGVPAKDSTGAYYFDIVVADTDTVYFAVTAWSGTLESAKSNEISRAGLTSGGGTTTPPSSPTTASAAVVGFALWNAQNDTVVDTNFVSGDTISDAIRACAAIEVKTNSYLTASGPGSVRRVFDGVDKGCENNFPYAWEQSGNGDYACAASLSAVGTHSLSVTPYDGDNCSGLAGAPVSINFTVAGSSSSGTTLGAPGQPYIVP
jgi:hypothetical protein